MLSLGAIPWASARRDPDAAALLLECARVDYRTLDRAASGMATALHRRHIVAGERVAILCANGLAFPVAYYGALRMGAVVAPLSNASPVAVVAESLRRMRIALLVCDATAAQTARAAARLAGTGARTLTVTPTATRARDAVSVAALAEQRSIDPIRVSPTWPAVIMGTSGTTGTPRRAVHSHVGLLLNARAVATEMLGLARSDVQLGALPLAHSFGMSAVMNASLTTGASVAVVDGSDPHTSLDAIERHAVTVLQGVPTMLARLADAVGSPPGSLRLCVVSGAPLPPGLTGEVADRLCHTVIERYGMTEVSPLTMRPVPPDGGLPGDVGAPMHGVVVRTVDGVDEGELEASAPTMFLGYDGDRRATRESLRDGFLRTGDLGRVGPDGRVTLVGRLKDVIVRGGNNVAAPEVERVLGGHPDVVEVAVVGVPDAELGEEVAAVVVIRRPAAGTAAVLAQLQRRSAEMLAAYKCPQRWEVVDRLPRTASGKVRKEDVRAALLRRD